MESRPSQNVDDCQFEVILKLDIARDNFMALVKLMKQSTSLGRITVSATNYVEIPGKKTQISCIIIGFQRKRVAFLSP